MRSKKLTRRLVITLLVAALLLSLPLAAACAKYVRSIYAGSLSLTISPADLTEAKSEAPAGSNTPAQSNAQNVPPEHTAAGSETPAQSNAQNTPPERTAAAGGETPAQAGAQSAAPAATDAAAPPEGGGAA